MSDWALREGIVLDAVRSHDPDDWSDDPRALRRASVASLARRCDSDVAHTHHVARARAAAVRPDRDAARARRPTTARCSSTRRCCTTSASTCRARAITATPRISSSNGELRGFAPDEVAFLAALVRHHRRGDPKPSEAAIRRAALDKTATGACASSPRCCASPTASTGAAGAWSRISTCSRRHRPRGPSTSRPRRRRARALGCPPTPRPVREGLRPRARARRGAPGAGSVDLPTPDVRSSRPMIGERDSGCIRHGGSSR